MSLWCIFMCICLHEFIHISITYMNISILIYRSIILSSGNICYLCLYQSFLLAINIVSVRQFLYLLIFQSIYLSISPFIFLSITLNKWSRCKLDLDSPAHNIHCNMLVTRPPFSKSKTLVKWPSPLLSVHSLWLTIVKSLGQFPQ